MQEPLITNYSKPANSEAIADLIPVTFVGYDYVLAFKLEVIELDDDHRFIALDEKKFLPPEIGTILAHVKDLKTGEKSHIGLKKCTEVLSEKTIAASNSDFIRFDDDRVFCLDPYAAKTDVLKGESEGLQIQVALEPCYK